MGLSKTEALQIFLVLLSTKYSYVSSVAKKGCETVAEILPRAAQLGGLGNEDRARLTKQIDFLRNKLSKYKCRARRNQVLQSHIVVMHDATGNFSDTTFFGFLLDPLITHGVA